MFGVFLLVVGGGQEGIVSCMSRGGGFGLGVFRLLCFSGVLTPSLRGGLGRGFIYCYKDTKLFLKLQKTGGLNM